MADLFTISAAARLCQCDRRTLQRAIHASRLHLDAQHQLSREELLATGYLLPETPHERPHGTPQETPQTASQVTPQVMPQSTPQATPQDAPLLAVLERLALAIERLQQDIHQLREHPAAVAPQRTPQERPQVTPRGTPHNASQASPQRTPHARQPAVRTPRARVPTGADSPPAYDTTRYILGRLCPRGHAYHGTGHTLRRLHSNVCPQCDTEKQRERRQARRQAAP